MIEVLKANGIQIDELKEEVNRGNHTRAIAMITTNEAYRSLIEAARSWKGFYDNMEEEEAEWIELNRPDVRENNEPMYGGLSDDWEEYLDMIDHVQTND